ncbi:hypothetical protein niasHT_022685 [Heterodera trifolii]|uniref:WASH complex subunit 7 n=1 Tax=Heterodera trifolii TaxID=157864 RepID=A0ABD2JRR5_9BILA
MDSARQSRARAVVVAHFGTDVLGPLRGFGNNIGTVEHHLREYCKIRSGTAVGAVFPASLANGIHPFVDACTAVFANLLNSADRFIVLAHSSLFDFFLLYGEFPLSDHYRLSDRNCVEMISDFLPHLRSLDTFACQCERLASCILRQLFALLAVQQPISSPLPIGFVRDLPMERAWRCLGDLLSLFLVFDEVIGHHPFLRSHWAQFVRSVRLAQHNPSQFALYGQSGRLQQFNGEIARLDAELMSGDIFGGICRRLASLIFGRPSPPAPSSADQRAFVERFRRVIMASLARWERLSAAEDAIPDKQHLLSLLALAKLFHFVLAEINRNENSKRKSVVDRKMIRALYATHKRVVSFYLIGDILFTPAEHIAKAFDPIDTDAIDRKARASSDQARAVLLEHQIEQMRRDAQTLKLCVTEWCHKMDQFECFPPTNGEPMEEIVDRKCNLLFDGAQISDRIGRLLKCILNGHLAANRPLSKHNAKLLFELIQHVKRISSTFDLRWPSVLEWAQFGCAKASSALIRLLDGQIAALPPSPGEFVDKNAFAMAAFRNAQMALAQMVTKDGIVFCGIALEMANYSKLLRPADVQRVDDLLVRLDLLSDFGALLRRVTDWSFLYWHRQFLCETFCNFLVSDPTAVSDLTGIKYFFDALNDSTRHFLQNVVLSDHRTLSDTFGTEMFAIKFLDLLCTQIENDLRLSYHSQQNVSLDSMERSLFTETSDGNVGNGGGTAPRHHQQEEEGQLRHGHSESAISPMAASVWAKLLHLPPFHLGNKLISVKAFVRCHLESTFYNLSVLALHDCDSYRRMALLALHRYHLRLADSGLPNMSVDQGLDLLAVMADVDTFVADYCYDLNEQFFIERNGHGKTQLNILRVHQVINSVKTHGLGILHSLINSAYKFLRVQFQRLSRCLFDERIKKLLTQEILFYRDAMDELDQMYPMGRAEKLANALLRFDCAALPNTLATSDDCLNKLRVLITRMGNLLGLLRLIRTGVVEFCSPLIFHRFLSAIGAEQKSIEPQQSPKGTRVAEEARLLYGRAFQNAMSNLTESRDCVELLTSVFAREFRCNGPKKFAHLRHFFIVVPALTLCHVQHTTSCRARLQTSARREATATKDPRAQQQQQMVFVEDGFSMGIAYVLTLFNQRFFFDSLNWSNSVQNRFFRAELAQCAAEMKEAQKGKDESLAQVLAVKAAQLEERRAEHRLLECTINSALTLFQANELLGEEEEEETFLEDL